MSATYPIAEARGKLGDLARRAAQHEHITLTDRGIPAAVLISPAELEDLEDALALARLERDRALGRTEAPIPTKRPAKHCSKRRGGRVTWRVLWEPAALNAATGHLKDDPKASTPSCGPLTNSPRTRPEGSRAWGVDHRRLHHGPWRILYRIDAEARTLHIEHIGRTVM